MSFILSFLVATAVTAAPRCDAVFNNTIPTVEKVEISKAEFNTSTQILRNTLSGKLATVWRSEWKTKLALLDSNHYVKDLVDTLLTPQTRDAVLQGLDLNVGGFVQQVHARLYDLQIKNQLQPADDLGVRDPPPPANAKDTTFTYYTKPLSIPGLDGKHQVRIRTYLREIFYKKMDLHQTINGFDTQGNSIEIQRIEDGLYKITAKKNEALISEKTLTTAQIQAQHGRTLRIFAPHGKSFKLEIKSALEDNISGAEFPRLAGKHMVQKLDVSLSPAQVSQLFAPLNAVDPQQRALTSNRRVVHLTQQLIEKNPDKKSRIDAVFNVIQQGIQKHPDFLDIEGATFYHRSAFESNSGFQTTIDRNQGVFAGNMYHTHSLKSPISVLKNNYLIKPGVKAERHVEFKVPVTLIEDTVGIDFDDPQNAPESQHSGNEPQIKKAIEVYHKYVQNNSHAGKFNFIRKNGELDFED